MRELRKADPGARRVALIVLGSGALAGAVLIGLFDAYRADVETWLEGDLGRIRRVVTVLAILTAGSTLVFAGYLWRLGQRTVHSRRYPPPGLRIVRDTSVVTGSAARRLGRLAQVAAAVLAAGGVSLALWMWRLASLASGALAARPLVALTVALALAMAAPAGAQQSLSIPADAGAVNADVYGAGDHAVVLAHGGRFDKSSWAKQAQALADAGFRVVAIDFRAAERVRAGEETPCLYDAACLAVDVLAAVRYLRRSGARTVSVVGASLGGGAAAQAAVDAREGEIDRIVLLAHMAIAAPDALKGRKLFVVARDDAGAGGAPRLPRIRDQYEKAPEPKRLLLLDGSAHAQFIFDTPEGERLMQEILRFLSEPSG